MININIIIHHSTIKIKPLDVKSRAYINSIKEINDKGPKIKIGDIVRISQYKNIFAKCYVLNCSEKVFVIQKNCALDICY